MNKIRIARLAKGMTQKQLANCCDISLLTIERYEQGVRKPSVGNAIRIAGVLGMTVEELFDEKSKFMG